MKTRIKLECISIYIFTFGIHQLLNAMPIYKCHDSDFLFTDIADYEGKDVFKRNYHINKTPAHGCRSTLSIEDCDSRENCIRNYYPSRRLPTKFYAKKNSRNLDDSVSLGAKNVEFQDDLSTCSSSITTCNSIYFDFDVDNNFIVANSNLEPLSSIRISDHKAVETCGYNLNLIEEGIFSNIDVDKVKTTSKDKSYDFDENGSCATMSTKFSNISEAETHSSTQTQTNSSKKMNNRRFWGGLFLKIRNIADEVINGLALELEALALELEAENIDREKKTSIRSNYCSNNIDSTRKLSHHS